MDNDLKTSEAYCMHIQNMPAYAAGAKEKGVSVEEFLAGKVGLDDDLIAVLLANWDPADIQIRKDLPQKTVYPDPHEKYHTFWPRFGAGFIDGVVLLPIGLFLGYIEKTIEAPVIVFVLLVTHGFLPHAYNVILHGKFGQTLGKFFSKSKFWILQNQNYHSSRLYYGI